MPNIWEIADNINARYHELETDIRYKIKAKIAKFSGLQRIHFINSHKLSFYIPFIIKNSGLQPYAWYLLFTEISDDLKEILKLRIELRNIYHNIGSLCATHDIIIQDYHTLITEPLYSPGELKVNYGML